VCDTSLAHTVVVPRDDSLADVPGVPESALPEALAGQLPDSTPAPPWDCRVEAVVWWHRTSATGRGLVPQELQAGLAFTVGAFVTYLDTPVGPYSEVLASRQLLARPLVRGVLARVHVPFIAVDSLASVHGGRAHWALPKAMASFQGTRAVGDGWQVSAAATARGPWLPAIGRLGSSQVSATGLVTSSVTTSRAKGRLARVHVETSSVGDLATWLLPGDHRGIVLRGGMVVGPASPG
jgi:hypothetical protein